jgi:hypothetical protein
MNKIAYKASFMVTRYIHMLIIAFLNIIFGFIFALLNSYIFPSTSYIISKYTNEDGSLNKLIYLEIIGYIIMEICIIVLEIYLIRNIVKGIGGIISNSYSFTQELNYVFYKEYSNNIMLGYIIYLFSFELNERFSFLIMQINSSAIDPLEKRVNDIENNIKELQVTDSS